MHLMTPTSLINAITLQPTNNNNNNNNRHVAVKLCDGWLLVTCVGALAWLEGNKDGIVPLTPTM